PHVKIRYQKARRFLQGQPQHRETVGSIRYMMVPLMRRNMGRHIPDFLESIFPVSLLSQQKMSVMDRIKGSAHDSNAFHSMFSIPRTFTEEERSFCPSPLSPDGIKRSFFRSPAPPGTGSAPPIPAPHPFHCPRSFLKHGS